MRQGQTSLSVDDILKYGRTVSLANSWVANSIFKSAAAQDKMPHTPDMSSSFQIWGGGDNHLQLFDNNGFIALKWKLSDSDLNICFNVPIG